jgi:hypothetical protein
MLRSLLLEELAILTHGDDFHCVILSYQPVESMPECFPTMEHHDECALQTPL